MSNYTAASRQWATRPADERFSNLAELADAANSDRATCKTSTIDASALHVVAAGDRLAVNGRIHAAELTHWSYTQLAGIAGAPAAYLRTLPAQLAADCLNHGLAAKAAKGRDEHRLLNRVTGEGDAAARTLRAVTSTQYSRVWDGPIASFLKTWQDANPRFELPKGWDGIRAGAYRGDRDMFVLTVDGGSIVEDPTLTNRPGADGRMFRGFIVRNSEVGASSFVVESFMFRFICGNHIIWGIQNHRQERRRHVGLSQDDALLMLRDNLKQTTTSDRPFAEVVRAAIDTPYVKSTGRARVDIEKDAIAALRNDGLSAENARESLAAAIRNEPDPFSVWGIVNGITRQSQAEGIGTYQDERYALDQIAGRILQRRAALVAA